MLGERLKKAREYKGFSLDKLSEKISVSKRTLQNYEKNDKEPTVSTVIDIAKNCHIDDWWLLTGKGEMLTNSKEKESIQNNDSYAIDMLNIKASAGKGIYNYEMEVVDKVVMDKAFFKTKPDLTKIKIIEVDGDSMYPTLKSGDHIIIDETTSYGIDGIYAIQLHGQILIKRLKFKLDGTINIISDNKAYEPELYNPKESQIPFHIIGMKTLSIQR